MKTALISKLCRAHDYLVSLEEWNEHGYVDSFRSKAVNTAARVVRRTTALAAIWLLRNGDDWTLVTAAKATACITLDLSGQSVRWCSSGNHGAHAGGCILELSCQSVRWCSGAHVAWWPHDHRHSDSWTDVEVGEGPGNWWFYLSNDTSEGYP